MKWFFLSTVTALVGVAGFLVGGPISAIAGSALAGLAVAFIQFAAERAKKLNSELSLDNVSLASRPKLVPLFKMRSEINEMLEQNADNPILSAMRFDIRLEMDEMLKHAVDVCSSQAKLSNLESGRLETENKAQALESKLQEETDDSLRESIGCAIEARKAELKVYKSLAEAQKKMESVLVEAEAAFSTLKSRVALSAAESVSSAEMTEEPLTEVTERMKRIASTMQETVELVRGGGL